MLLHDPSYHVVGADPTNPSARICWRESGGWLVVGYQSFIRQSVNGVYRCGWNVGLHQLVAPYANSNSPISSEWCREWWPLPPSLMLPEKGWTLTSLGSGPLSRRNLNFSTSQFSVARKSGSPLRSAPVPAKRRITFIMSLSTPQPIRISAPILSIRSIYLISLLFETAPWHRSMSKIFSCPMSPLEIWPMATSSAKKLLLMVSGSAPLARRSFAQASSLRATALHSTVPRNWFTIVPVGHVLKDCIRPASPPMRIIFWKRVTIFPCKLIELSVLVRLQRKSFIASSSPLTAATFRTGSSIIPPGSGATPLSNNDWKIAKWPLATACCRGQMEPFVVPVSVPRSNRRLTISGRGVSIAVPRAV